MRKRLLPLLLLTSLLLISCAVTSKNPNLSPQTAFELNTASQLHDMGQDYKTLFRDVGDAQRAGVLLPSDVAHLNGLGNQFKPAYEKAVEVFRVYRSTHDAATKQQVIILVLEAEKLLLELTTARTAIGGK